ncbi:SDR family oxidoreductase [Pseudolactococcus insecticola]|uniref:Putative NAD-dependent epimerase/dehydratase n=1 Tax=Pseudolactococcus insecticola TaxID=2709158 RepID=A0A6A0B6J7_9LACT|nr:SDR family oxidoreductase [Lactococcus insecticola]GFH40365.1 putative NAD-dependent epimerase/dehydratase [Lactococcus insecticola]
MKIFVTGGTGFIGSHVVPELLTHGHSVLALARTPEKAAQLEAQGATPVLGTLADIDLLKQTAGKVDAVIHLAFIHNWADMSQSGPTDQAAINAFGDALRGTNKALVITSGVAIVQTQGAVTEVDLPAHDSMRGPSEFLIHDLAKQDIRAVIVRPAPTVHGVGDHGFVKMISDAAAANKESIYISDANSWAAVNVADLAVLYRLAVESAPADSVLHGVAENVPFKAIATAIGEVLQVPVTQVDADEAQKRVAGLAGNLIGVDAIATSDKTRDVTGWTPTHDSLLADIESGNYI